MKHLLLLTLVLFLAFSCSDTVSNWSYKSGNENDLTQTVKVNQLSINQDSINQLIQTHERLLKMDQDLLSDIQKAIDEEKQKFEQTNDLAKKVAYQNGVATFTRQKMGPLKRIQEKEQEIERLKAQLK